MNTILPLRVHPTIVSLRDRVISAGRDGKHEVDLTYVTSRGNWYMQSWKGDNNKSGSIVANIGVHFFDMLQFIFGDVQENHIHLRENTCAAGYLEYERARVRWFLSLDVADVPAHDVLAAGFPCQPFSLAGVSKKNSLGRAHGFDDPTQGTLFFTI